MLVPLVRRFRFAASAAALVAALSPAAHAALNDTGALACIDRSGAYITQCAASEQDAAAGRDVRLPNDANGHAGFSYVKLDKHGAPLPADADRWACVRDRVSGLVWEVKTTGHGPRSMDTRYTNWNNGESGDAGTYAAGVNAAGLCGFADWRLPTMTELQGLLDLGVASGAPVDADWLGPTQDSWYWTSTGYAGDPDAAWAILFDTSLGGDGGGRRDFALYVRLVHSDAPPVTTGPYRAKGDEVLDASTGLVWRRCAEGQAWTGAICTGTPNGLTFADALARTRSEGRRTGQPWRMPNLKELGSIADRTRLRPAVDPVAFPGAPAYGLFWSGSPFVAGTPQVFVIDFYAGYALTYEGDTGYENNLRLVRDAR